MKKTQKGDTMILSDFFQQHPQAAIGFSGGVDSAYLAYCAKKYAQNMLAIYYKSEFQPEFEFEDAKRFCTQHGIPLKVLYGSVLNDNTIIENPKNRCYLCKHELFEKIWDIATKEGLNAVAEGSNMDDNGDYRPGLQAVAELGVKSPLRHSELYKEDIRALSKDLDLPTWEKQSFACLSSRFVYGETITKEKLGMVDKAEQLLLDLGFHQLRVRIHGTLARIEVLPDELQKVLENRNQIVKAFKEYGFTYVTMDIQGYRMGSMNETLKK